mmetsp:Transcript_5618/g.8144  ORF Transcript_5618/g.8144 Transcript_5618/m.8144 type:complete len:358 (+) Transcript_5618:2468-3541(+)
MEAKKVLPKKLSACRNLLDKMMEKEDAIFFLKPLVAEDHGVTTEQYEKQVKQPMDLGTIRSRLDLPVGKQNAYDSVSGFSKDVNRIFSNVLKVWVPGQDIADGARRLQGWWMSEWTSVVPVLMSMKLDEEICHDSSKDCEKDSSFTCGNERGNNFQEQIGMPDEENMRNWSHHHTTDTVDDPVFRAAMRGCDSVSFTFGLEVTWSLIQQRLQEEEERQAMMELEEAQKSDFSGGTDEDTLENDNDKLKRNAKNDGKDSSNAVSRLEDVELGRKCSELSTDTNEISENPQFENNLPPQEDTRRRSSNSSTQEVDTVINENSNVDELRNNACWECTACTYVNKSPRKSCQICGTKRVVF